ncbi:MAG: methylenetetrahydromethanopterin dehydrogenase [Alphaproteobacteria bacterium GM202ARS2]|nr:methylenetetrahydromethanopterin dehydrogenase [Alphaproteobacteria bacterium GM202ARS2]
MKDRKYILHMASPAENISPFDVNMAYDAGFDVVVGYSNIDVSNVRPLVQDAIFSRSVKDASKTGLFIGGKDLIGALDMLDVAKAAMVPPFEISVFPDPAGSFTTGAAMVACAERTLHKQFKAKMADMNVVIYGGKGIVGGVCGILCAQAGARVTLVGYDGVDNVAKKAQEYKKRFGCDTIPADGSSDEKNTALLKDADVVFCAARAGTQVLSLQQMKTASVKVIADANAVPPAGIEGAGLSDDDTKTEYGAYSIGPLTSGDVKVKTQYAMFQRMCQSTEPLYLDFQHAADIARSLVSGKK